MACNEVVVIDGKQILLTSLECLFNRKKVL